MVLYFAGASYFRNILTQAWMSQNQGYFLSKMEWLKNTSVIHIRQLHFFVVAGTGGEEEVLTSDLLSSLSFLLFLGLRGIFLAISWSELGLTCSCMSYLTRKTYTSCRICTRYVRSHILHHMHNCSHKWQIGHILHLVLKFCWTWDSSYLGIFILFYSSVQVKGFERMLKLEGRWQIKYMEEQCTLCLSCEKGRYRFWKAL